jgi:hypothetical protein
MYRYMYRYMPIAPDRRPEYSARPGGRVLSLLLFSSFSARAGEIALTRGGSPGLYVFLDGEAKGKLTKKTPLTLSVDDGTHELWLSWDEEAWDTACHGTMQLTGTFSWEVAPLKEGCDRLANEIPARTRSRGALLSVTKGIGDTTLYTLQLDGRYVNGEGLYNVAPGTHTVLVKAGAGKEQHQICVGTVTLDPGESGPLLLTPGQCVGFDNEVRVVH